MNLFHSILLGVVEGLTEFIPVSSTFHLIATANLLNLENSDFLKLFLVVIQSGAILSVSWLYYSKITTSAKLQQRLILSFIPTALIGALLYKLIKNYFFVDLNLQLIVFAVVGVLFIIVESRRGDASGSKKTYVDLTSTHALLIGAIQALSIIPGVSRSGSILLGMIILGYSRSSAAEYAFMLSLPTILGATALDLYQNSALISSIGSNELLYLVAGTLSAFFSALWVMRWLIQYLSTHSLTIFGYYRLIVVIFLSYLL